MCEFLKLIFGTVSGGCVLGASFHTSPNLLDSLNTKSPCRVIQDIGLCSLSPVNGDLTPILSRFMFTGGSNVTLEGSTDPYWGWVNSYGQQVES